MRRPTNPMGIERGRRGWKNSEVMIRLMTLAHMFAMSISGPWYRLITI